MSLESKITFILHTANRPEFLFRALTYYDSCDSLDEVSMIVLDSSDEINWNYIQAKVSDFGSVINLKLLHHDPGAGIAQRFNDACSLISTPYVLLTADDDFYYVEWLEQAVSLMEHESTIGVVYGHTITFDMDSYSANGDLINIEIVRDRDPPAKWLEDETTELRLSALGSSKDDWASVGWYTMQRAKLFDGIVRDALANDVGDDYFEKFLTFCQTAKCRTRMIDAIYLARQRRNDQREPWISYREVEEKHRKLRDACAIVLAREMSINISRAVEITEETFRCEVGVMKRFDSKKNLLMFVERSFPNVRGMWHVVRRLVKRTLKNLKDCRRYDEARFPAIPKLTKESFEVMVLSKCIRPK